jgi:PIN domain nuclease of toxin-antitoxin system
LIYLDTHVVVWLYAGLTEIFGELVRRLINDDEVFISPIARLELQYLYEIQRVKDDEQTIVSDLANRIGLQVCTKPFNPIVTRALAYSWTRDPFDRLIVAQAALQDSILVSKDQTILANYAHARWE